MMTNKLRRITSTISAAVIAVALSLSLAACGESSTPAKSPTDSSLAHLDGVSATGTPGQKLKVTLKTPLNITNQSYAVLQDGNGDAITDGDRLCMQQATYNARTGEETTSTWEKNTPDCSALLSTSMKEDYRNIFLKMKVNGTVAFGMPAETGSSQTGSQTGSTGSGTDTKTNDPYVLVLTVISKSRDLTRAEGTKVTDIPSNLPKVTLDDKGAPSIDEASLKAYQPGNDLVVQPLIKGNGATVNANSTVNVQYTGWLPDGTKFDSSWDKGQPFSADLSSGVIQGWSKGLAGQTVGSQVMLIIPPSLGYGDKAQGKIPANSTLIFVIDILSQS